MKYKHLSCGSGLSTEQMLLKDMKTVSGGDLRLAVSVIYMTLEVSDFTLIFCRGFLNLAGLNPKEECV